MNLMVIIGSIIVMSLTIAIGTLIEVRLKTTVKVKEVFIFIIINLAVPGVILRGFLNNSITESTFFILSQIFIIAIGLITMGMSLGYLAGRVFRFNKNTSKYIAFLAGLGNTGFVGLPLINNVYGSLGSLYGSIYDVVSALILFSIGIMLLQKNLTIFENTKSMINAPVLSVILGIIISFFGFDVPKTIINLVDSFASLAGPLAMLYIGFLIPSSLRVIKINNQIKVLFLPMTIKLLILPLAAIIITHFLHLEIEVKQIILIQSGMPTILLASVLLDKYADQGNLGTLSVIYTTLLSMITIPLMILLSDF